MLGPLSGLCMALSRSIWQCLTVQGRLEAALADYDAAVLARPGHARALYNRALTLERLQRWDAALADHAAALSLEPSNATVYASRCINLCMGSMHAT